MPRAGITIIPYVRETILHGDSVLNSRIGSVFTIPV
jgi:hypothetical protein